MIGYILLLLFFLGLVTLCFLPGLVEFFKPKDAGPLAIDMTRNIDERYFSQAFRRIVERALRRVGGKPGSDTPGSIRFYGVEAKAVEVTINRGNEKVVEVFGDLVVPANSEIEEVLVIRGNITTGNDCVFKKEILTEGDAKIGDRNHLLCISAVNIDIGISSEVEGWLDADENIHIASGCTIKSRATAGLKIIIEDNVISPRFAAPDVDLGAKILDRVGTPPAPPEPSEIDWTPDLDRYLTARWHTDSLEDMRRAIMIRFQMPIPEILILRRASMLGLVEKSLFRMETDKKPAYLRSNTVWLQGGETARLKGNIEIPDGEVVPFNLIVAGNLTSGEYVVFQGGVHVRGSTKTGMANRFWKSLVGERDITLGDYTIVENCVDSNADIRAGVGVQVGVGLDGGGMSASGQIVLAEGFAGHNKTFADQGVISKTGAREVVA